MRDVVVCEEAAGRWCLLRFSALSLAERSTCALCDLAGCTPVREGELTENWPREYRLLCEGGKWNEMTELCDKRSVALLAAGKGEIERWV